MPLAAAIIPAVIGGGVALASGAQQSRAADRAATATQNAADQSSATQRYIFDTARNDNRVRQQAGDAATNQLMALLGLGGGQQQPGQPGGGYGTAGGYAPGGLGGGSVSGGSFGGGRTMPTVQMMQAQDGGEMSANGLPMGQANALQGYGDGRQVQPGQQGGTAGNALTGGQSPTDILRSTPGYQFNLDAGQRQLNASLANRGGLLSGDAGREAIRYGQNYGDRIYGDYANRLAGIAGMGQVAAGQNQQAGMNYANNQTSINTNTANALGSSYQNSANAWTNALGGVGGALSWGLGRI